MESYKFKVLDEDTIKHFLNEALNKCLEKEKIKIDGEKLAHSIPLELDYYKLLSVFEEHIKDTIRANNEG